MTTRELIAFVLGAMTMQAMVTGSLLAALAWKAYEEYKKEQKP